MLHFNIAKTVCHNLIHWLHVFAFSFTLQTIIITAYCNLLCVFAIIFLTSADLQPKSSLYDASFCTIYTEKIFLQI